MTIAVIVIVAFTGCTTVPVSDTTSVDLLSPEHMAGWRPTAGYERSKPWTLQDGVYWGHGGIMGYEDSFSDYILEVDFLFDGMGEGGIQIRGDRTAERSWEVGYELDIDWAAGKREGHIHFPVNPSNPYVGEARFEVGIWHTTRVVAIGPQVVVHLDGKQVLQFEDAEFPKGQLLLQGEKNGVRYRNIKVTRLD